MLRRVPPLTALVALLGVLACTAPAEHEATGYVVSLDPAARTATIRHPSIPGVMGATTIRFPVQSAGVLAGVAPRDHVRFVLRERDGRLVIVRMAVSDPPDPGPGGDVGPAVHDHSPHHGGVVGMSGMLHLEALARPDGTVRVYLTDVRRRPRPLDGVSGRVTIELPSGDRELTLRVAGDALEAKGDPLVDAEVTAHVELAVAGEPVEMDFLLPTGSGAVGAAGVPTRGCAVVPAVEGRRMPRCVLPFERPVTALAATPDGSTLLVAAIGAGVSAWRMPEGSLVLGFEAPPPITLPDVQEMQPHPEGASAIAIRPDGREAVVALENRLLLYDIGSGRLLRQLPAEGGIVRGVDWSPDGRSLVVTRFYDASAQLLRPDDGVESGRLAVGREAAAAGFSDDGRLIGVGGEAGELVLFAANGAESRRLTERGRAVAALAFVGPRLLAGRDGGVAEVWSFEDGRLERELPTGTASVQLAAHGDRFAVAAAGGAIHVVTLGAVGAPETLSWHPQDLFALTWAGTILVSADAEGRVALWDY